MTLVHVSEKFCHWLELIRALDRKVYMVFPFPAFGLKLSVYRHQQVISSVMLTLASALERDGWRQGVPWESLVNG